MINSSGQGGERVATIRAVKLSLASCQIVAVICSVTARVSLVSQSMIHREVARSRTTERGKSSFRLFSRRAVMAPGAWSLEHGQEI